MKRTLTVTLLAALSLPATADVKLAQVPLAKAASQPVAPNLLFVLDDSGSMGWDYTPDLVDDSYCRTNATLSNRTGCRIGHPPYMSAGFNKQFYDPRIRYAPGVKADGTSYPEMTAANTTNWTQVPQDGYKSSSSKTNLVSGYTNRKWCNPSDSSDCRTNSNYTYPDNTYTETSTDNNVGAYYFNLSPIYCTDDEATNCSTTKGGSYVNEFAYRWCKSGSWTDCKAKRNSSTGYTIPSFLEPVVGVAAVVSFKIGGYPKNTTHTVTSVKVNGIELLGASVNHKGASNTQTTNCTELAKKVVAEIGNGFTATNSGCTVTLTSMTVGSANSKVPVVTGSAAFSSQQIVVAGKDGFVYFNRVNITPGVDKYQIDGGKPTARTDCVAFSDGCSYTEEMTNFSNWYAYYRIRLMAMKSAVSQAFKDVDTRFRVGYTQINTLSSNYVSIRPFDAAQRTTWYDKLLGASTNGSTPLREALAFAGRVYAGKKPGGIADDPVQYSCQQNFTLLTTDGYWNGTDSQVLDLNGTRIGNLDGSGTDRPYYEGPTASSTSLADTAMYYYNSDLRTLALNNCTSLLTGADVCENNVPVSADDKNSAQHMTTFTLGLGIDGQLRYRKDYKTATSGDFYKIKTGTMDWPKPAADTETAVDDLWHAAVNGRGQYFSAQDPAVLVASLKEALSAVAAQFGAGAAAATSNLEPVSGDNFLYIATYTTGKWIGNLESRQINTTTGQPQKQAVWCAENVPADPLAGTTACTGTMAAKVGKISDTRKIYIAKSGSLVSFTDTNLTSAQKANFDVSKLTQYVGWNSLYKTTATSELLVNYLRGQTGFDTRPDNTFRLFRERESVLGDIVGSKPVHVCKPQFSYIDPGFEDFKNSLADSSTGACKRKAMVYVGANDGMLHAFNATTGVEEWAFIPTPALSEMWRIADSTYSANHRFYVDGSPSVNSVCVANCDKNTATWKTILVAGMNAGVVLGSDPDTGDAYSGYFALDITDPDNPKFLWEINSQTAGFANKIGFTTGNVEIGKVVDASGTTKWAAVFSSGYKTAAGTTHLFVVDAYTGSAIRTINLPAAAEGLSRIRIQTTHPQTDATFSNAYGGDLAGNVWRMNVNTGAVARIVSGMGQPITTRPEISLCNAKPVIYIGTGKFIEAADLTDQSTQSLYGFLDDYDESGTITAPRSTFDKVTVSGSGTTRTISSASGTNIGWYLDLPDKSTAGGSERINIDPLLQAGTLIFQSNVPDSGICVAGGHSWTNVLQMRSCSSSHKIPPVIEGSSQYAGNELGVGITIIRVGGVYVPIVTGSGGSINAIAGVPIGQAGSLAPQGKYTGWRELMRD